MDDNFVFLTQRYAEVYAEGRRGVLHDLEGILLGSETTVNGVVFDS